MNTKTLAKIKMQLDADELARSLEFLHRKLPEDRCDIWLVIGPEATITYTIYIGPRTDKNTGVTIESNSSCASTLAKAVEQIKPEIEKRLAQANGDVLKQRLQSEVDDLKKVLEDKQKALSSLCGFTPDAESVEL